MIEIDDVTFTYDGAAEPVLREVTLTIDEGELCLIVGPSGSGKTTLLRLINGLVPHFSGGTLAGRVTVQGRDTRLYPPRELADVVGFVPQDPESGFVADTVEDEIAYGMEAMGLAPEVMRRRVEESLDLLALASLRQRALRTLSGGEKQRVAIAAALAAHPRVLVLDEPTSALDPGAAEEVLASLTRLVHDLGVTVVVAEHRLERVVQYADRVVSVPGGTAPVSVGDPASMMRESLIAPPVVELGRWAGWSPLPLSVRDARRAAGPLRDRAQAALRATPTALVTHPVTKPLVDIDRIDVSYGRRPALTDVSLRVGAGEVVALMGRNGAGKSTLLSAIVGLRTPDRGRLLLGGHPPSGMTPQDLVRHAGLVPQQAGDLLYADSVAAECREADRDGGLEPGTTRAMLQRLAPRLVDAVHPGDLSEGNRLALALAVVLAPAPPLLLLDEPTRGLDYAAKRRLADIVRGLAAAGHGIIVATHDVELAAEVSTRTLVLAEGELVADGPTHDIVVASPMFAPQVAKIMAPLPLLTVDQVVRALEVTA